MRTKVTRDFNLGVHTVVEFLAAKGHVVEASPNAKIPGDLYVLLEKEFGQDKAEKAASKHVQPDATRNATWIAPLRNVDGLIHVVRDFDSPQVFHALNTVDAARDVGLVDVELLLALRMTVVPS